jgi:hypothetical protein
LDLDRGGGGVNLNRIEKSRSDDGNRDRPMEKNDKTKTTYDCDDWMRLNVNKPEQKLINCDFSSLLSISTASQN